MTEANKFNGFLIGEFQQLWLYGRIGVHLVYGNSFSRNNHFVFIPALDLKQSRCTLICTLNYIFLESVNTKNIMYLSVGYMHMLQCIIKPRLDLKSTH